MGQFHFLVILRNYCTMSNKPIKKGDQNKAWNRKNKPSRYKVETREPKKTIVIFTEGQTEKLYFESFPVLPNFKVTAIDLQGQSKLKMIEIAEQQIKSYSIDYDEVWCVFDMDFKDNPQECADFDNAITKGENKGYKIAYSNDAFELWFYLHFQFTDQAHHRTFYYQELSKIWNKNYEKYGKGYDFAKNIYSSLATDKRSSQQQAIKWAIKLYNNQKYKLPHKQNPVTKIYQLVEELNKNLKP